MDALAYDLKRIALGDGEGSYLTRNQRHRGLQLMARELRGLGFKLPAASSLKPRHVEALISHWQTAELSTGTLKNRMGWLRWWAGRVRKANVVPRGNESAGIENRTAFNGNRAHTTQAEKMAALPHRIQLALRLQMAFGMRLEESLKFRVSQADKGHRLAMQSSWCKGGRAREIPVTHPRQRALLDELRQVCGDGSLIPQGQKYVDFRKEVERVTWGAGIRNMHGHRHWYAQWRYETLTGRPCPASGGATYERLSRTEKAADFRARRQISSELGHARLAITDTYLGSRFAKAQSRPRHESPSLEARA
ncbi:putative DNA breaking-rejoining enzyme, catalytic core superfamily; putative phage integrase [Bradyrhizobium sp. ORS 278]|uniref:phage integrase N-terminal domain-containing protein n=1 Tax=Bradyrhizobium sp. (strain ORS 278) TaxID=114615 RepID=UPI00015084F0|nr:phage integrase N-terminal domain-containing protein [Bradyrhizobium sp. ORS 278]CAL80031.1 putative DNA breaking-rejoining enzyme, catalytic core superfamily; putative phage integrase [Bradyrhizobium sp. ORS 278]